VITAGLPGPAVLGAAIDRVCRWLAKDHFHRIEATTCWQTTFAAMRAAGATNLGPILRLRAYAGFLNRHDWRAAGSTGSSRMLMWWWRTALTPATGVYLNAEGRFVAIGMATSGVT
jgi:hypothetical protein